ncbi:hypothetical protein PsorP6_001498 [Peronosclerospora sorghi]|uniref:Uncharacterized protein n=1 Tax=Peronosclerospora sorghi TaxID=230839 RepID=A0ACC0WR47_9STRA|nr:hypothetical protein PsorP6_001498 [Peronosclerospora sorghi]
MVHEHIRLAHQEHYTASEYYPAQHSSRSPASVVTHVLNIMKLSEEPRNILHFTVIWVVKKANTSDGRMHSCSCMLHPLVDDKCLQLPHANTKLIATKSPSFSFCTCLPPRSRQRRYLHYLKLGLSPTHTHFHVRL